jgi:hypothetical protein
MGRETLLNAEKEFLDKINKSYLLVKAANTRKSTFNQRHKSVIAELSFFKIYLAWERFLEEIFIMYMMKKSKSIRSKFFSFVQPNNKECAKRLLFEGDEYAEWKYGNTVSRAERFFKNGFPFKDILNRISTDLNDIQVIRNGIAHNSDKAKNQFSLLVRTKMTFLPTKNFSPGDFLLSTNNKFNKTYLETYSNKLISVCTELRRIYLK